LRGCSLNPLFFSHFVSPWTDPYCPLFVFEIVSNSCMFFLPVSPLSFLLISGWLLFWFPKRAPNCSPSPRVPSHPLFFNSLSTSPRNSQLAIPPSPPGFFPKVKNCFSGGIDWDLFAVYFHIGPPPKITRSSPPLSFGALPTLLPPFWSWHTGSYCCLFFLGGFSLFPRFLTLPHKCWLIFLSFGVPHNGPSLFDL